MTWQNVRFFPDICNFLRCSKVTHPPTQHLLHHDRNWTRDRYVGAPRTGRQELGSGRQELGTPLGLYMTYIIKLGALQSNYSTFMALTRILYAATGLYHLHLYADCYLSLATASYYLTFPTKGAAMYKHQHLDVKLHCFHCREYIVANTLWYLEHHQECTIATLLRLFFVLS